MPTEIVAWLESSNAVRGQDPLGVRAPCEYVYNKLLPGITNVTDRARYFSFYPWLIWAIDQHQGKLRELPLYEIVRRADCLFTMIAAYHNSDLEDNFSHGALIGSIKLSSAINEIKRTSGIIHLSTYAATDSSSNRYFKNKLGGLGQYYISPLRDAGILAGSLREGIRYTDERGLLLAEAFDEEVNGDDFLAVLERDEVLQSDLDNLVWFCPCNIVDNSSEQRRLLDFFFNRQGDFYEEENLTRTDTLKLLLDLIDKQSGLVQPTWNGVHTVLACLYGKSFPDSSGWALDVSLEDNRLGWQQYFANDLLSYALQSLFWAGLEEFIDDNVYLPNSFAYAEWFAKKFVASLQFDQNISFASVLKEVGNNLPAIENWRNESHEIQLGWQIQNSLSYKDVSDKRGDVVSTAVQLLLCLAARWQTIGDQREFPFELPPKFNEAYPINLLSFAKLSNTEWSRLSFADWLKWVISKWNIEIHLKVALRKLHHETLDTFKIIPAENGLEVIESVLPTFTSPRIKQALQILLDLGAVKINGSDQRLTTTPHGKQLLEEQNNG